MPDTVVIVDTINGGVSGAGWDRVIPFTYPGNIQTAPPTPDINPLGSYGRGIGTLSGPHSAGDFLVAILSINWLDDLSIPLNATINFIQFFVRFSGEAVDVLPTNFVASLNVIFGSGEHVFIQTPVTILEEPWTNNGVGLPYQWSHDFPWFFGVATNVSNTGPTNFANNTVIEGIGYTDFTDAIINNPLTGDPLTRDDIFNPSNGHWGISAKFTADEDFNTPSPLEVLVDQFIINVNWTDNGPPEPPELIMTGSGGIALSGSMANPILSADASGIYTLVKGKRNDTLYLRFGSEETVDVAIPDPFAKTAFFGG